MRNCTCKCIAIQFTNYSKCAFLGLQQLIDKMDKENNQQQKKIQHWARCEIILGRMNSILFYYKYPIK